MCPSYHKDFQYHANKFEYFVNQKINIIDKPLKIYAIPVNLRQHLSYLPIFLVMPSSLCRYSNSRTLWQKLNTVNKKYGQLGFTAKQSL